MITLDEARRAANNRSEFVVKETESTVCFDYMVVLPDSFTPSDEEICALGHEGATRAAWIRRNFRGVTFCARTGDLLSLPLQKFFNLNQNEESSFHLHRHKRAVICEKLDGSMIHFYRVDGRLVASTCRSSENVQAKSAMAIVDDDPALKRRLARSIEDGLTPVFELVAPWNQIVVRYDETRLVYLVSRSRVDGSYVFEDGYQDCAKRYDFAFSEVLDMCEGESEGYVCHLEDGLVLKVKTPWYTKRHRSVDAMMRPAYKLYELCLDGAMDDIISLSPDAHRPRLEAILEEVQKDLLEAKVDIEKANDSIMANAFGRLPPPADVKLARKAFADAVRSSDPDRFSEHMMVFGGRDPSPSIKKRLMEKYRKAYPNRLYEIDPEG